MTGCGGGSGGSTKLEGTWTEVSPGKIKGEFSDYVINADGTCLLRVKVAGADLMEWKSSWEKVTDTKIHLKAQKNGVVPVAELLDSNTMEIAADNHKTKYIRKKE